MGKILHVLALAILTWNCVAYSYTIRNMYKRMPVDRSSQGIRLQKLSTIPKSKSVKSRQGSAEPAGIPLPTLSSTAQEAVFNVRNELSSLGGSIIGGFTGLTGLKLKDRPGFDLPSIPSTFQPGVKGVKKTGGSHPIQTTKLVAAVQAEKQFKRQVAHPNFNAPPYVAQKQDPETIWYTEQPKAPLHVKIGQDLKGLVDSVFARRPSNYQLIAEDNTINTGSVRDERDSTYGAPASPVYGAPEATYEAAEPSYGAPEPATSYGAPESSYDAAAPSYAAAEAEDILNTMIYGSEEKLPLLIKIITDYNKVFNFYASQSAQMAAFYAPGLIPILRKAGFDVKRINWVPELIEKLKPVESASYGAPVASYGEPEVSSTYGEPEVTYDAPEASYGAPATAYEQPEPSYGAPAVSYQPVATEPVPVYYSPSQDSYGAPSHYAPPAHNHVHASSKRDKKDVTKSSTESLDVVPEHHDELLTAVPALELLKLKRKLNRKEARERIDQAEERVSRHEEISEAEERTSRLKELKETLEQIETIEEENENELNEA